MTRKGILIVEDENIVALDVKMRLESLGYTVLGVVDTGPAALKFLSETRPDLVLMDIKLKGDTDGIDTARRARETVDVPIIFVTAFTDEATLERAKLASPYGYIVKPFHERELRIAIELALYKFEYELSMRHAKELAEEANRLKGEFLANVSHELKTPLNSVIGFTELSLDRSADEEQREYLSNVLRSARSLVMLIDSILDYSKLENGSLSASLGAFSLDSLLGECVEFLAIGAAAKGLEVSYRRDPALPDSLVSDRGRLRQILMNLADNAVKFTDRGRIRLRAELAPAEGAGKEGLGLRIVFEDSGMGMPPEKIAQAFERFTQLDGSRTRPAGGTGLGLAIVAKSIQLLSGTISVKSAPGQGSVFEMLLPVSLDESRPEAAKEGPRPLEGQRFALVGFNAENGSDLAELLSSLGASSVTAQDLSALAADPSLLCLAAESAAIREIDRLSSLRGRVLAACRPGFAGRAVLAAEGCAIVPSPVRAKPLLEALERRPGSAAPARADDGGHRGQPLPRPAPEAGAGPIGQDELQDYLAVVGTSIAARDVEGIERESKRYRDIFQSNGAEAAERLAFSILLCSRKGDWSGLEDLAGKGRRMLEASPAGKDVGGKANAFPGR